MWWTLNCGYSHIYDIHRFNVGVDAETARAAVAAKDGTDLRRVRFQFTRNAPDICSYMMALRSELHMRVVMPTIVPHTKRCDFQVMARYEVGTSGNPHWHGLCVGANNPSLKRVKEDVSGTCCGSGDVPVRADECKDLDVS